MKHLCFYMGIFIVTFSFPAKASSVGYIDSLKNILSFYEENKLTDSILNTRLELIKLVRYSDFEFFLKLSNSNLELAKDEGLNWAQIDVLMEIGEILIEKGLFGQALENLNKSLELAEADEYRPYVGWVCISIGNAYEGLMSFLKAIDYYQRAYTVFKEEGVEEGMALSATNIGNCYQELFEFEKAESYLLKGLKYRNPETDFINRGYVEMYLAEIKVNRGNYIEARNDLIDLVSGISNKTNNLENANEVIEANNLLSTIFWVLSDCEYYSGNKGKSIEYLKKAVSINRKINNKLGLANMYNLIGNKYMEEKEFGQGLQYADSALDLAIQEKTFIEQANSFLLFSGLYKELNNHALALKYYEKYKATTDSMFNNSVVQAITDVNVLVKTIESEKNNQILALKVEQKQKLVLLTATGGGLIIIIVSVFIGVILLRLRKEKKLTDELSFRNEEILQQSNILEKLNDDLVKLNTSKDKFNSIIAHDLKNPAATVYSLIDLLKSSYDEYPEKSKKELIEMAHDMSLRTINLLEKLLTWSRIQDGRMKVDPTRFYISEVLEESQALSKNMADSKGILMVLSEVDHVEVLADKEMITTVIRNFHSNAIKFTKPGKKIESGIIKHKNGIEVWVKDEGIGIPEDKINSIFDIDPENHRNGTNDEPGTGLGLQLCDEFIKLHNGKIIVESEEGKGSRFAFHLPV